MKNRSDRVITTTGRRPVIPFLIMLCMALLYTAANPAPSPAAEGSWSHYVQGTYGDFGFGVIPTAGFSFRNDLIYNKSSVDQRIFGGKAYAEATQDSVIDLMKFFYFYDVPVISGKIGFGALVPGVFNANADASLKAGSFQKAGSGHAGGFSDIAALPLIVNANKGNFHFTFLPAIFLPTGYYNSNELVSLGRNYYTLDLNAGFTWLDPKLGLETSFNLGYMINSSNNTTSYGTGDEFHLDYMVAQHLSERFGFGVTGYVYQQATGDTGTGAILGPDKSSAAGFGPAIMYSPNIFGKDFTIIGKWLHDTSAQNRFMGDTVFLSFAFAY